MGSLRGTKCYCLLILYSKVGKLEIAIKMFKVTDPQGNQQNQGGGGGGASGGPTVVETTPIEVETEVEGGVPYEDISRIRIVTEPGCLIIWDREPLCHIGACGCYRLVRQSAVFFVVRHAHA